MSLELSIVYPMALTAWPGLPRGPGPLLQVLGEEVLDELHALLGAEFAGTVPRPLDGLERCIDTHLLQGVVQ